MRVPRSGRRRSQLAECASLSHPSFASSACRNPFAGDGLGASPQGRTSGARSARPRPPPTHTGIAPPRWRRPQRPCQPVEGHATARLRITQAVCEMARPSRSHPRLPRDRRFLHMDRAANPSGAGRPDRRVARAGPLHPNRRPAHGSRRRAGQSPPSTIRCDFRDRQASCSPANSAKWRKSLSLVIRGVSWSRHDWLIKLSASLARRRRDRIRALVDAARSQ